MVARSVKTHPRNKVNVNSTINIPRESECNPTTSHTIIAMQKDQCKLFTGFFGRLNFLYLPVDFKRERSLGYALINLVTPSEALRLGRHFEGFSNWCVEGGGMCTVAWCSPQQGLDAHVERYRNSPVMHESMPDEWRPILLAHGVPIPFPAPTLKIKAPKFKGRQQVLG